MNAQEQSLTNPFVVLGLPLVYRVSAQEVERAYLKRMAFAHPDRVGESGGIDAALLNDARAVLLDPENRANALIEILGGKSASQDRALPDDFLMEMMQRRQEIEEDLGSGDEQARERWTQWAHQERTKHEKEVGEQFDCAINSDDPLPDLQRCRITLNAWRYIERLIEQLDPDYDPSRADFS